MYANVLGRVRRVKCDEEKPTCRRCKSFGRVCDGYEIKKIKTPDPLPTRNRSLLPIKSAPVNPPSLIPVAIAFEDETQGQYFRFFYEVTSAGLSGGIDNPAWDQTMLQACCDEPCILQCVVALGALDRASKSKDSESLQQISDSHHQYALQQYGKALNGMQDLVARGPDSTRNVLIASLAVFAFENFHGDTRLALRNVKSALELMHHWLESRPREQDLRRLSPVPDFAEDALEAMFTRLEVHILSWTVGSQTIKPRFKPPPFHSQHMPMVFTSLIEARHRLDQITTRAYGFLESVLQDQRSRPSSRNVTPDLNRETFVDNKSRYADPPVARELRAWKSALEPILQSSRSPAGDHDFVGASTLRAQAIILDTGIRSALLPSSNSTSPHLYDIFLPEYCEVVALCRSVATHPRFVKTFVFDGKILPLLFAVFMTCRDRVLRKEVIMVWKLTSPRREGIWDSTLLVQIGEGLLKAEEEIDEVKKRNKVLEQLQHLDFMYDCRTMEDEAFVPWPLRVFPIYCNTVMSNL